MPVVGCRIDPVLELADGTVLHIAVEISAPRDAVREVDCGVHLPKGAILVRQWESKEGPPEVVIVESDKLFGRIEVTVLALLENGDPPAPVGLSVTVASGDHSRTRVQVGVTGAEMVARLPV